MQIENRENELHNKENSSYTLIHCGDKMGINQLTPSDVVFMDFKIPYLSRVMP